MNFQDQIFRMHRYHYLLLDVKGKMTSDTSSEEKVENWLKYYHNWVSNSRRPSEEEIIDISIMGHVLAHPDFMFDRKGRNIRKLLDRTRSQITIEREKKGRCRIDLLIGMECPFNEFPSIRGDLQGDHLWPYSLGGPSNSRNDRAVNRILLCPNCNRSKSSGIIMYNWKIPPWLENRLREISEIFS